MREVKVKFLFLFIQACAFWSGTHASLTDGPTGDSTSTATTGSPPFQINTDNVAFAAWTGTPLNSPQFTLETHKDATSCHLFPLAFQSSIQSIGVYHDYVCHFWDNQMCHGDALAVPSTPSTTYPRDLTTFKSGQWNKKLLTFRCVGPDEQEHKEEPSTPVFQVATTLTWDLGGTNGEQYKGMADDPNACLPIHVDEYTYLEVGDVAQCYFWGLADCSGMPLEIVYPGEVSTPVGPPARANWRSFRCIRLPYQDQPSAFASSDAKANLAIDAASGAASSGFSSSSSDEITCPQPDSAKWNTIIVGLLSGNLLILIGILGVNLTGYLQEKRKTRSYAPVYGKDSDAGYPVFRD